MRVILRDIAVVLAFTAIMYSNCATKDTQPVDKVERMIQGYLKEVGQ